MLMISGVGVSISSIIISRAAEYAEWAQVLTDCCLLMRGLCVHDDIRKDMSCAYENGRFFLKQNGMVAEIPGIRRVEIADVGEAAIGQQVGPQVVGADLHAAFVLPDGRWRCFHLAMQRALPQPRGGQ